MARVPDEAIRRRREITTGAWHLYELYCLHRNSASGLCNPSNSLLAAEMRSSYTHVSDCKTELVKKGWIAREGRQRVKLLIGEFAPLKVRDFGPRTSENSELQLRNFPNLARSNFGEFRTSTSELSEPRATPPAPPIRIEPVNKPEAAATAAAEIKDFRKEPLDDAFCKAIVEAQLYPPDLVEFVKHKLNFRCAQEGSEPTKGRLLYWLSIEREEPIQRTLPMMPSGEKREVVKGNFDPRRAVNPSFLLPPQPDCASCQGAGHADRHCDCQICPYCFTTGMEVSDQGARPCQHHQGTNTRQQSAEAG